MFFGSARYGAAADNVLPLEVVLADGKLLRTGQSAIRNAAIPAYRLYGPDFAGMFLHDSGAIGVKAEATFRLIRTPAHTGFASFAFSSLATAAAALSEIARSGPQKKRMFSMPTQRAIVSTRSPSLVPWIRRSKL